LHPQEMRRLTRANSQRARPLYSDLGELAPSSRTLVWHRAQKSPVQRQLPQRCRIKSGDRRGSSPPPTRPPGPAKGGSAR
jgi:hypothetical protein